jgi:glycosyltransferase involved in cell wall biosynthesis
MAKSVCFISSFFPPLTMGGVERYLLYVTKGLTKHNFSSGIVTRFFPSLPKKEKHSSYSIYRVGLNPFPNSTRRYLDDFLNVLSARLTYSFFGFYDSIKLVKKFDVIHSQIGGLYDAFLGMKLASKLGKPTVTTVHGKFGSDLEDIFPNEDLLKVLRNTNTVIVNRNSSYDFLVNQGLSNVILMQNPIPVNSYKRPVDFENKSKNMRLRVLFVGRLSYRKGPHLAVESFISVAKNNPNIEFLVVGDGPMQSSLVQYVKNSGLSERIRFLGKQFDVKPFLWTSDIFLATSPIANFPSLSLREAMAAGLPVIATDVGETRNLVAHNETGIVVSVNTAAVEDAILRLMFDSSLRQRLGKSAANHAEKTFDLGSYCKKLAEIYRSSM